MKYLQLVRYKNLLFIIVTQLVTTFFIIDSILKMYHLPMQTSSWVLALLVAATTLIAAGGYIINDYFDVKIDRINRPQSVLIGASIDKRVAMRIYQVLTGAGVAAGLALAIVLRHWTIGLIFVIVPGMLWFYSASYKRQLLIGNLIVALSVALVPLLPLLVESKLLVDSYDRYIFETPTLHMLFVWVCGFAAFAFIWTMIREIIKDIQDEYGDREMECRTMPIVWGINKAKIVATALIVLANALLIYLVISKLNIPDASYITLRYAVFGIATPSICLVALLWSRHCNAIQNASNLCKFIMLIGIGYSLIFHFLLAKAHAFPFLNIFEILP